MLRTLEIRRCGPVYDVSETGLLFNTEISTSLTKTTKRQEFRWKVSAVFS